VNKHNNSKDTPNTSFQILYLFPLKAIFGKLQPATQPYLFPLKAQIGNFSPEPHYPCKDSGIQNLEAITVFTYFRSKQKSVKILRDWLQ
jgi:hypothetical protein